MRKFKQVKRKEIVYGVDEWKVIEERAAALSIKTGTYIKRFLLKIKMKGSNIACTLVTY